MDLNEEPGPARGRGIYLLPNLLTTGGLFAGFYAILAAASGNFENACIAVFVAGLFDGIDGRVARMTGTTSAFGREFDSLAASYDYSTAAPVVDKVDCANSSFTYTPGTNIRSGLVTIRLTLSANGESISLLQQVHVDNAP